MDHNVNPDVCVCGCKPALRGAVGKVAWLHALKIVPRKHSIFKVRITGNTVP
jgi:hypothetical protein